MSGRKSIGFVFNVTLPLEVKGTPTKRSLSNNLDYIGDLVTTKRITGEDNVRYKQRIWDASVHKSGADYQGVINEIGRSLGYLREKSTITINIKLNSNGTPIAPNARVDVLANRVVLYSDWRPDGTEVIDKEIYTYHPSDEGFLMNDLVQAINESEYFSCVMDSEHRPNDFSSSLIRESSADRIPSDYIRGDKYNELDFTNVVEGSLTFEEIEIFKTEVTTEPSQTGEYKVDYYNGNVVSYDTPSDERGCSFHYNLFPMEIDSSPVQIYNLHDENFTTELFDKETGPGGEPINGLPNEEGSEIYHQLFMRTKVFWGE